MGKLAGISLVPLITVALVALLLFLPRIDPLRKNYAAFRDWYDGFILVPVFAGALATVACPYYAFRKEQEKSWKRSAAFFRKGDFF